MEATVAQLKAEGFDPNDLKSNQNVLLKKLLATPKPPGEGQTQASMQGGEDGRHTPPTPLNELDVSNEPI